MKLQREKLQRHSIDRRWHQPLMRTIALLACLSGAALSLYGQSAIALNEDTLLLLTDVPDPYTFAETTDLPSGSYVSPVTISQTQLTVPSLWWTHDQLRAQPNGSKLLETWFAFPSRNGIPSRVDLVVNQQVWSLYNYIQRYAFLNQFGTAGHDFGYSTRVFNRQRQLLAAYICEPESAPNADAGATENCNVFLDSTGQGGLQGGSNSLGGLLSTGGGTAQP